MYILFAISMLCLFALVLAAVAIARHVRAGRGSASPQPDFSQHLFAAAADQDSRPIPQQNAKDVVATTSWDHALEPTLTNPPNPSISSKRF
jgi:hypothetical protein